jgi:subtilisin family serine protease
MRMNLIWLMALATVINAGPRDARAATAPAPGLGAELVGLDLPGRFPGSFLIVVKPDADLSLYVNFIPPRPAPSGKSLQSSVGGDLPLAGDTPAPSTSDLVQRLGDDLVSKMPNSRLQTAFVAGDYRALLIEGASDDDIKQVVAQDPRILRVGANFPVRELGVQSSAPWHLSRISNGPLPPLGSNFPNSYTYDNTASGVLIYIVDTGVLTSHTDFGGRAGTVVLDCVATVNNQCSSVTQGAPGLFQDCAGHGTHIASNAAGNWWGVAKQARIAGFIINESGNGGHTCEDGSDGPMKLAFRYIVNKARFWWKGPQIIELSTAIYPLDPDLENNYITPAINAGITVVAAVPDYRGDQTPIHDSNGNVIWSDPSKQSFFGEDPCSGSSAISPSHTPGIINVGGTTYASGRGSSIANNPRLYYDWAGLKSAGWDRGSCVTAFAPGTDVLGANNTGNTDTYSGNGTSYAAPLVAGVAAIYLQTHAHASPAEVKSAIAAASLTGQIIGCYMTPDQSNWYDHYVDDTYCPLPSPNQLLHLPLPTGADIAVGGWKYPAATQSPWNTIWKGIVSTINSFFATAP